MKFSSSILAFVAAFMLASSANTYAVFIDFNTQQDGTPYSGLGDSFVAGEYNGVTINDSDPAPGSTFVNLTNPVNVGTAINGYYVNIGAFASVQTRLTLDFTTVVTEVAFDFASPNGSLTVRAFALGGGLLGQLPLLGAGVFVNQAGFNQLSGHVDISGIGQIARLEIEPNFNHALIFDNLDFQPVPVPAALPLLLSGLLGLSLFRRRRQV